MSDTLAEQLGEALRVRALTICTAESCTGGLVLHRLTNIPGSSDYVLGGVVAYANDVKQALLGVPAEVLALHGAVSAQTAKAMALGILAQIPAQIALSVTGIAGPGGGSAAKPVGLTYLGAVMRGQAVRIERHVWPGDREEVKFASATRVLEMALALAQDT